MHTRLSVIHRDVKPSNILINREGSVKMCDFGISGYLVDSVAKTVDAGCKPYMAVSLLQVRLKIAIEVKKLLRHFLNNQKWFAVFTARAHWSTRKPCKLWYSIRRLVIRYINDWNFNRSVSLQNLDNPIWAIKTSCFWGSSSASCYTIFTHIPRFHY